MKVFGLIGFPLTHSWSAQYFKDKFEKEGIPGAEYRLFPLPQIKALKGFLKDNPELGGFNVTIPYKVSILPFLNETDAIAREIGAVNTVKVIRDGEHIRLKGFNTDAEGFLNSLPSPFHHQNALILGTGGGSKAVAWALKKSGVKFLMVSRLSQGSGFISYQEITREILQEYTLIINTTPVGMFPKVNACPLLQYETLTTDHLLYDLVYNPKETLFLRKGRENGAHTINGLRMLVGQAEAAWRIFNNG